MNEAPFAFVNSSNVSNIDLRLRNSGEHTAPITE